MEKPRIPVNKKGLVGSPDFIAEAAACAMALAHQKVTIGTVSAYLYNRHVGTPNLATTKQYTATLSKIELGCVKWSKPPGAHHKAGARSAVISPPHCATCPIRAKLGNKCPGTKDIIGYMGNDPPPNLLYFDYGDAPSKTYKPVTIPKADPPTDTDIKPVMPKVAITRTIVEFVYRDRNCAHSAAGLLHRFPHLLEGVSAEELKDICAENRVQCVSIDEGYVDKNLRPSCHGCVHNRQGKCDASNLTPHPHNRAKG